MENALWLLKTYRVPNSYLIGDLLLIATSRILASHGAGLMHRTKAGGEHRKPGEF